MKRVISTALLLVMVLGMFGLLACGGGGGAASPTPTPAVTATPTPGTSPAPDGPSGFTWNDMPIYPGAH
ncbi:MAG: hypothetical protein IBX68_06415 [Dehalococcoidia bacterium]|nr:hypothetical protein [Dehalococcoidia bacterium]